MNRGRKGDGSVWQRADGRWVARLVFVDDFGKKSRADKYAKTKKEAEQLLRQMRRHAEDGSPVVESALTVATWSERWIDRTLAVSPRKPTTKETYSRLIRHHMIGGSIGVERLDRLTPSKVEEWLHGLLQTRSEATCRQVHAILCMILDGAVREGLVRRNVARAVSKPRVPRTDVKSYSLEEVSQLLMSAKGDRLESFLRLLVFTGLRKGEALGLRWSEVDFDAAQIRVTGTLARVGGALTRQEPKTSKSRRSVPLVPEAIEALRDQRVRQAKERLAAGEAWTDSGYVFTTEAGTPVDPRNALRWFYLVRDRAGIDAGSLHSFRHAAASVLLSNGVPMPVVSDVLGHSSISITVDMYGHMAPSVVAAEVQRGFAGYGS